jgi:hypothetical protein
MGNLEQIRDIFEKIFIKTNIKVISIDQIKRDVALMKLKIGSDERTIRLKILRTSQPQRIKAIIYDLITSNEEQYTVLIVPSISNGISQIIKEAGYGYMDMSGNIFISFDNVHLERSGNRNQRLEKRTLKNIFSRKASRIVRAMLSDPNRKWNIEALSSSAGTSMGLTSIEIKRLSEEGFVESKRNSVRLVAPKELLDAWSNVYSMKGKRTGYYCPIKDIDSIYEKLRKVPGEKYALTLGSASMLVAPSVRTTDFNLYTSDPESIIDALELVPVEFGGNVILIEPEDDVVFKDKDRIDDLSVVSIIQLYLDLYQYPTRGKEQAEAVRNKYLEF